MKVQTVKRMNWKDETPDLVQACWLKHGFNSLKAILSPVPFA